MSCLDETIREICGNVVKEEVRKMDLSEQGYLVFEDTVTGRGFPKVNFKDAYGEDCRIQLSSIMADEQYLWLGVEAPTPKILCQDAMKLGLPAVDNVGWQNFEIPKEAIINSSMHLSFSQVKSLIKELEKFIDENED